MYINFLKIKNNTKTFYVCSNKLKTNYDNASNNEKFGNKAHKLELK